MPNDLELLATEVETLFIVDGDRRLVGVNEPGSGPAPRFLWGSTAPGSRWWRRADLPAARAAAAAAILDRAAVAPLAALPPAVVGEVHRQVSAPSSASRAWQGPSFVAGAIPQRGDAVLLGPGDGGVLTRYLPEWVDDVRRCQPVAAVLVNGDAVAVCATSRRSQRALEAGVETHPHWRRQGHAVAAVARWAAAVHAEGLLPFYSTSWENEASQRVAARLGLRPLANLLHIT